MPSHPLIVSIGDLLWKITPWGKQLGGASADFAFYIGQTGAKSYIISAIGNEPDSNNIIARVRRAKINSVIERTNHPTGVVWIELKDGKSSYKIIDNAAWDYITLNEQKKQLIAKADAIYFNALTLRSEISRNSIQSALNMVSTNTLRVFDINLYQDNLSKELVDELLSMCDVVKINSEALPWLVNLFDIPNLHPIEISRWIREYFNIKFTILLSQTESIACGPLSHSAIQIPQDDIVNTLGVHGAFLATFVTYILKGEVASFAHQRAIENAVHVSRYKRTWVRKSLYVR